MCCACHSIGSPSDEDACVDTDIGVTNEIGWGCNNFYDLDPENRCGLYDTDTFNSYTMCCACANITNSTDDENTNDETCVDTDNGYLNNIGSDCSYYDGAPTANCGHFHTNDFNSYDMCCSCHDERNLCIN